MPGYNLNQDKELLDNLKRNYAAMDAITLHQLMAYFQDALELTKGSTDLEARRETWSIKVNLINEELEGRGYR
jgi:hypothetical protein